jgi:hypothetical protein
MLLSKGYCDLSLTYKAVLNVLTCKAALLYTASNEKNQSWPRFSGGAIKLAQAFERR